MLLFARLTNIKFIMGIEAWCHTDKGLKRESNQDSFLLDQQLDLYIVADGMGGHSGGEVASAMAVQAVQDYVRKNISPRLSPRDLLQRAYEEASKQIFDRANSTSPELMGMGTTMVLALRHAGSLFIANVGDSRAYLYRKPYLWQLTEDHSLVNEQVRAGILTEDRAKNFIGKNVITRSVGYERDVIVDVVERPVQKGDSFLFCSDGLSSLATDLEICEILGTSKPEDVVHKCVEKALKNGGDDNVTVLYLQVT